MENGKQKIEVTMNMLVYMNDFFEKLKILKEDENETMACITFYKDKYNKVHINTHISEIFEILIFPYKNEISSIMQKFIELIDSLSEKDFMKYNTEYELCDLIISPKEDIFEIQLGLQEFAMPYILEDGFEPIAGEISNLLERMENTCANMFNKHVLNQEN